MLPEYQKQGIGGSLLENGLSMLKEKGGQGCALVGDPNYYSRFGFRNYPELLYEGIPPEYFLALPFTNQVPHDIAVFHPGFQATC